MNTSNIQQDFQYLEIREMKSNIPSGIPSAPNEKSLLIKFIFNGQRRLEFLEGLKKRGIELK